MQPQTRARLADTGFLERRTTVPPPAVLRCSLLLTLCLASACSNSSVPSDELSEDVPAAGQDDATRTAMGDRVHVPSSGSGPRDMTIDLGEESRLDYCAGQGPPVQLPALGPGAEGPGCGRDLARSVFQFGLCACEDATFTGAFEIDGFNSAQDPTPGGQVAASIGINDDLITTGLLDVRGSLIAASSGLTPIVAGGYNIDGNYLTNSDLVISGAGIRFGRDLWVNGDIAVVGFANVEGDVYQTPPHSMVGMTVAGQVLKQDFTVPEPCRCGTDDILDINAIVQAAKSPSHNADIGLDDGNRVDIGIGQSLPLECGRYAFEAAHFVGVSQLRAYGRTALFVDGDLTISGAFNVDLGEEGTLDVFVTGNLLITGTGDIGSVDRPAALRFYVGGAGDIAITGATRFAGNLYAPRSHVLVTGAEDIYGSFFVGSYTVTGAQRMHYDSAILGAHGEGEACDSPPTCGRDLDCPGAKVCRAGVCRPLLDGPD